MLGSLGPIYWEHLTPSIMETLGSPDDVGPALPIITVEYFQRSRDFVRYQSEQRYNVTFVKDEGERGQMWFSQCAVIKRLMPYLQVA